MPAGREVIDHGVGGRVEIQQSRQARFAAAKLPEPALLNFLLGPFDTPHTDLVHLALKVFVQFRLGFPPVAPAQKIVVAVSNPGKASGVEMRSHERTIHIQLHTTGPRYRGHMGPLVRG